MLKSVKVTVDEPLGTEFHQLCKQILHKICAAMEVLVDGVGKVSTTKRRQFEVRLNGPRQVATTWSYADCQKAIEQLEREIHQVTPVKRKLFDKLFQYHEQQLLQEVRTKATSHRCIFAKELTLRKAAT